MFHVDDDEVIAGETGDLGEGRGEAEEEETVQGLAIAEARFEALEVGGGGGTDLFFFFQSSPSFSSRSLLLHFVCVFLFGGGTDLFFVWWRWDRSLFCFFFCFAFFVFLFLYAFCLCGLNSYT